ncbi:MAG: hypothetical protein ACREUW_06550 [Burkholderiales bacterium]
MRIPRITGLAAKYSTAYLGAGILMVLIGASKATGYDYQQDRAQGGASVRGDVISAVPVDCVDSYKSRRFQMERHISCYRLEVNLFFEPNKPVAATVMAEQDAVGEIQPGDKVIVVMANDGSKNYFVINARDTGRFSSRKYPYVAMALAGLLLVIVSLLCKTPNTSMQKNA